MGRKLRVVLRTWYTRPLNWLFAAFITLMVCGLSWATLYSARNPPTLRHKVMWTSEYSPDRVQLNRLDLAPGVDLASRLRGVRQLEVMNVTPNANGHGGEYSQEPLTREQLGGLRHGKNVVQLILRSAVAPDAWKELAALDVLETLVIHNVGQHGPVDFSQFPPIPSLRCVDLNLVDWVGQIEPLAERNPRIERLIVRDIDLRRRDGRPLDLSGLPRGLKEILIYPALEQTTDPPYLPKWRSAPTPTISAGWKYSALSQELLGGLARLPGLQKVWLYDLDVREWGQAEAVAALPNKSVAQVTSLEIAPSPVFFGLFPLIVFPTILLTMQVGIQFSHPLSRTLPGYAAPHQRVAVAFLLIPTVVSCLMLRLGGAAWFPAVALGLLGTGIIVMAMGYAHIAKNPRQANLGGLLLVAALLGGISLGITFPSTMGRWIAGEFPAVTAIAGLVGLAFLWLFIVRLPRMICRLEEAGLRNMFANPFDGQAGAGQAFANLPRESWTWEWVYAESNPIFRRQTPASLLATPADQARLVAAGSGFDTRQILLMGALAPLMMWASMTIIPIVLTAGGLAQEGRNLLLRNAIPLIPIAFCLNLALLAHRWIVRRPQISFEATHPLSRGEFHAAVARAIAGQHAVVFVPMLGWTVVAHLVWSRSHNVSVLALLTLLLVLAGGCVFSCGAIQWMMTERRQWLRWVGGGVMGYFLLGMVAGSTITMVENGPTLEGGLADQIRIGLAVVLAGIGWALIRWSRSRWLRTEWGLAGT